MNLVTQKTILKFANNIKENSGIVENETPESLGIDKLRIITQGNFRSYAQLTNKTKLKGFKKTLEMKLNKKGTIFVIWYRVNIINLFSTIPLELKTKNVSRLTLKTSTNFN